MEDFDDWKGAAVVSASKLFTDHDNDQKKEVTNDSDYAELLAYLPGNEGGPLYLVGRAVLKDDDGPFVKLFTNSAWDTELLKVLEPAEFRMATRADGKDDMEHLKAEVTFFLGEWQAEAIHLYWHLPGPDKPSARVDFTRENQNQKQTVSAFWCWAE